MKTGISEGYICECGRKYQRVVFPNEVAGTVSCPCSGRLIHLWTDRVEVAGDGQHMRTATVFQNPRAIQIMDAIRQQNERKERAKKGGLEA